MKHLLSNIFLRPSIPRDDVSSLLPKGFNNKKPPRTFNRPSTSISSIKQDDVSKFLPPGFKFAGGGIAKEAGDSSGPPPESGPNSQGLPGLLKRVRNL